MISAAKHAENNYYLPFIYPSNGRNGGSYFQLGVLRLPQSEAHNPRVTPLLRMEN